MELSHRSAKNIEFDGVSSNRIHWSGKDRPSRSDDEFFIEYFPVQRRVDAYHQEFLRVCERVASRFHPLIVHYSGGMDSEFIARGLREVGASFQLLFFKYRRHLPSEIAAVESLAAKTDLPLVVQDFDENAFLHRKLWSYTEEYRISEPFVAFEMERVNRTEGFPVLGSGDLVLFQENGEIFARETGSHHLVRVYLKDRRRFGFPHLLQSASELVLSFFKDPIIQEWMRLAPLYDIPNSRFFKEYLYRSIYPDMPIRKKWTGYERFGDLYLECQTQLHRDFAIRQDRAWVPVSKFLDQLSVNPPPSEKELA